MAIRKPYRLYDRMHAIFENIKMEIKL